MATVSGAASKSELLASEKLSLPITRERWFPLLTYEAVTHPASACLIGKDSESQTGHQVIACRRPRRGVLVGWSKKRIQYETAFDSALALRRPRGRRARPAAAGLTFYLCITYEKIDV